MRYIGTTFSVHDVSWKVQKWSILLRLRSPFGSTLLQTLKEAYEESSPATDTLQSMWQSGRFKQRSVCRRKRQSRPHGVLRQADHGRKKVISQPSASLI